MLLNVAKAKALNIFKKSGFLMTQLKVMPILIFIIKTYDTILTVHYANTPVQYKAIFQGCKNVNFQMKNYNVFSFFALKR